MSTIITNDEKIYLDVANRVKKVNDIYYQLNNTIFGKKEIDKEVKVNIYNTIVAPPCGSETWTIQQKYKPKLVAAEMKYLRNIEQNTKLDLIRNPTIRNNLNTESLEKIQLVWYGDT